MTTQRYVVLSLDSPDTGDAYSPLVVDTEAELRIDALDLDDRDAAALRLDPRTIEVAPAMPITLVEPVEPLVPPSELSVETAPASGNAWGVEAVGAHLSPFTGAGVTVAVLDTGIDAGHPAFEHAANRIAQQDFTTEGNGDWNGHGTHCAGTLFGGSVNGVRIGVAPGVERALICKVLASNPELNTSDRIFRAVAWAEDHGAQVISMSLGLDFSAYVSNLRRRGYPEPIAISLGLAAHRANLRVFDALASVLRAKAHDGRGALVIAASGNGSARDQNPEWVAASLPPAAVDGWISVGALAQVSAGLRVAPFSNFGANVAAPGVGVLSAWPGRQSRVLNGTSMAAPHVAGVAAHWAEEHHKYRDGIDVNLLAARVVGKASPLAGVSTRDAGAGMAQCPRG